MDKLKGALAVAAYNFRRWHKNPRIVVTFALAFILCFMLSDKVVRFAQSKETTTQLVEAFVWTFGDSNSILLASLLLLLLFADMPFIGTATPFFLMRIDRKTFILGQALYITGSTMLYMLFILGSTVLICMQNSFIGNIWSETAAMLGYSGVGQSIAIPAFVKVLELSRPYYTMVHVFLLMLHYTWLMAFIMLYGNLSRGPAVAGTYVFGFSLLGFLLKPDFIMMILKLPKELKYQANVLIGWLSPLNHATYYMHSFGYDLLPRLWQTYLIFEGLIFGMFLLCLREIRKYNFNFTGTEG